jgi:hypothetical protein
MTTLSQRNLLKEPDFFVTTSNDGVTQIWKCNFDNRTMGLLKEKKAPTRIGMFKAAKHSIFTVYISSLIIVLLYEFPDSVLKRGERMLELSRQRIAETKKAPKCTCIPCDTCRKTRKSQ